MRLIPDEPAARAECFERERDDGHTVTYSVQLGYALYGGGSEPVGLTHGHARTCVGGEAGSIQ